MSPTLGVLLLEVLITESSEAAVGTGVELPELLDKFMSEGVTVLKEAVFA